MIRIQSILLLAVTAASSAACGYPGMRPGSRCGSCHDGDEAPKFSAAGTLYSFASGRVKGGLEGATLNIVDAEGRQTTLESVDNGNFYTMDTLTPPLRVTVSKAGVERSMTNAPSGECNSCHTGGSSPGRIHLP